MPNYIQDALTRFHHPQPKKPQDQPHHHITPNYDTKQQFILPLSQDGKKYVQEVVGTLLYYSHTVDCIMLAALRSIATQQANPTEHTKAKIK